MYAQIDSLYEINGANLTRLAAAVEPTIRLRVTIEFEVKTMDDANDVAFDLAEVARKTSPVVALRLQVK